MQMWQFLRKVATRYVRLTADGLKKDLLLGHTCAKTLLM
jgi:hypothetical protein